MKTSYSPVVSQGTTTLGSLKNNLASDRVLRIEDCQEKIKQRVKKQRGVTLVEVMIVVGILGIFGAFMMSKQDTSNSKATRLYGDMNTAKAALIRAKMDMGAFPSNLTALWLKTNATAANMFGGLNGTTSWNGAYMEQQPVDSSNAIKNPSVSDAVIFNISREAAAPATNGGNYTWVYYLRASNVPNAVINKVLKQCTGSEDATAVTFVNATCRATLGTGATEYGTVDVRVDDSY
jgi:prepilin-type N-terminal cleavage/methylation domain-containing protein